MACLQLVQNAVARLLTGTKRRHCITTVLSTLYWLPVHYMIQYKSVLFVFKDLQEIPNLYLKKTWTEWKTSIIKGKEQNKDRKIQFRFIYRVPNKLSEDALYSKVKTL